MSVIVNLCVYILTWNVASHDPKDISMRNALALNGTSGCPGKSLPDIYVVALQEVKILKDDAWTSNIYEQLRPYDYIKVETEKLQGIHIMLFSNPKHKAQMKNIEVQSTRTGLGGLWGNKGAVSIRMSLYGTGVTFIGSHLAAHDDKLSERVEDYNQIVKNHHYKTSKYKRIFDHDFVFWFGDLNFRLNGNDSPMEVRNLVEQRKFNELLKRDQLSLARSTGSAFAPLSENLPTFPPTFKFVEGTSVYDLKRRPAWCDRILHRVQENRYPNITLNISPLTYKSHADYILSDHKPVSAAFLYKIKAQTNTIDEIYAITHGGGSTATPLASVTILFVTALIIFY